MAMPVLGRPSLEESYQSLANWSCTGDQAGRFPTRWQIQFLEAVRLKVSVSC